MKPQTIINLQLSIFTDGSIHVTHDPAILTPDVPPPPPPPASEIDLRAALLAAVKATDKATAVGVLENIAGVSRAPEVPEVLRGAVIDALNDLRVKT